MKRIALGMLLLILLLYFATYVAISYVGKYKADVWGLSQRGMIPKNYRWQPLGVYDPESNESNTPLLYLFAPLYVVDIGFWHPDRDYRLEPGDPAYPAVLRKRNDPTFRYSPPDSD